MLPVLIYTVLVVGGLVYGSAKLISNHFGPWVEEGSHGNVFVTYIILGFLYAWIATNTGMIAPIWVMIGVSAVNLGLALYEVEEYGGIRYTLRGMIVSVLIAAYVVPSLIAAVA